jgi:hypothetical protein
MSEATTLAQQHRQGQLQIRARALRDFLILWPLWNGDDASFARLVQATTALVIGYRRGSAALAGAYYTAARVSEGESTGARIALAVTVDPEQLAASMYVTTRVRTRAGEPVPEDVRQAALTRVSGAVTRHVLDGGRQTILNTVATDPSALGWARVTDGDPCFFCLTLASRGAVYKTEKSASFQAHDHCGCSAMAVFSKNTVIPDHAKWRDVYEAAQRAGIEDGTLQHGENSSKARLNAVRRHLAQT